MQQKHVCQQRTGEVDHGLVCGYGALLYEQLVEVLAACGEDRLVRTMLLPLDQQRDVTELVIEALRVQLVQHSLAVSGEELVHLALTVHLQDINTHTHTHTQRECSRLTHIQQHTHNRNVHRNPHTHTQVVNDIIVLIVV